MSQDQEIQDYVRFASKLPPPLPKEWHMGALSQYTECMCGKNVTINDLETLDTGVLRIISNVCRNCRHAKLEDRSLARVVCCCCKQVCARMAPHTTPSGFRYVKNVTYHVDRCAKCHPDLKESMIIEEQIYNRKAKKGRVSP